MAATNHAWYGLALFCAAVLLAGCASLGPELPLPAADEFEAQSFAFGIRTLNSSGEFEVLSSTELAQRLQEALGERPLTILALSSGGASGAFGAGALAGSTSRGTRPDFTVVTGVSVGALVAPFAFLGPARDGEMTELFTAGATDGLLQPRGLGAVFGSSIYSAEPLRRLIERYTDDAMIADLAREAAKGRVLLVATTDFASGEPVIWDLGSIALHGGKDAKPLIQAVLLASASVPGMLPPAVVKVRIRGKTQEQTHVDGGVALPFFIAPAPEDLPRSTGASTRSTAVRVLIDGPLRNLPRRTHANAFSVFTRSLSAGLSHMTRTKLQSTLDATRQRGISLDYAAIPASYPLKGAFDFSPQAQRALFRYAANCAQEGRLWIAVHEERDGEAGKPVPASGGPTCPADDAFIGQLAALNH
jgi:predicted acylesterase/phospholipase RssA